MVLIRVDDRLIHGQVVVGWGRQTHMQRIVLVDDELHGSEWEQELYRTGVPDGIAVEFPSVDEAVAAFDGWRTDAPRTIVLLPDVNTVARLGAAVPLGAVNLGGIHDARDRQEWLPYVYLSPSELVLLRTLSDAGVAITAQDVPTARPVPLGELVGR